MKSSFTDSSKNALHCIICRQMRVANEVFATFASLALVLVKETGHCLCVSESSANKRPVFNLSTNEMSGFIRIVTHVWDNLNTDTFVQVLCFA